ncbi:MAG: hypothetical protein DMF87_17035 [Acidobacteria bacterium]|nr:MAG: hypothetical protein DMF87_17035 [Acidobacteriota bacterium]
MIASPAPLLYASRGSGRIATRPSQRCPDGPLTRAVLVQGRQRCCAGWVPALAPCLLFFGRGSLVQASRVATRRDPAGMSDQMPTARRYHWLSASVTSLVNEPPEAICSDLSAPTLNLVSAQHWTVRVPHARTAGCRLALPPSGPRLGSDLRHARQHARWRRPRSIAAIRWKR